MKDIKLLPTISIIVPNYNGGTTIGKTLQSLVDQNYPKLEIIVVDGGSTDNSVEVIKQFEPYITWWVSEKDSGQSNAINKGFAQCTGEIVNWLCSDELLNPGALQIVGEYFAASPNIDVLVGACKDVLKNGKRRSFSKVGILRQVNTLCGGRNPVFMDSTDQLLIHKTTLKQIELMPVRNPIHQSSCFYRRELLDRSQPVDESYHYYMDFELWNYFCSQGACWSCIDEVLSIATTLQGHTKTSTGGFKAALEAERIYNTYVNEWIPLSFWYKRLRHPLECFLELHSSNIWLFLVGPLWLSVTTTLAIFYGWERVWTMKWNRRGFG